jgi:hypothetical protein
MPPNPHAKVTRYEHDPASCIGNPQLGRPLDGLEDEKRIGVDRDGPSRL